MPHTPGRKIRSLINLKFNPQKWDINFNADVPFKRSLRIPMFLGQNKKAHTILDWCCRGGDELAWLRPMFPNKIFVGFDPRSYYTVQNKPIEKFDLIYSIDAFPTTNVEHAFESLRRFCKKKTIQYHNFDLVGSSSFWVDIFSQEFEVASAQIYEKNNQRRIEIVCLS